MGKDAKKPTIQSQAKADSGYSKMDKWLAKAIDDDGDEDELTDDLEEDFEEFDTAEEESERAEAEADAERADAQGSEDATGQGSTKPAKLDDEDAEKDDLEEAEAEEDEEDKKVVAKAQDDDADDAEYDEIDAGQALLAISKALVSLEERLDRQDESDRVLKADIARVRQQGSLLARAMREQLPTQQAIAKALNVIEELPQPRKTGRRPAPPEEPAKDKAAPAQSERVLIAKAVDLAVTDVKHFDSETVTRMESMRNRGASMSEFTESLSTQQLEAIGLLSN